MRVGHLVADDPTILGGRQKSGTFQSLQMAGNYGEIDRAAVCDFGDAASPSTLGDAGENVGARGV